MSQPPQPESQVWIPVSDKLNASFSKHHEKYQHVLNDIESNLTGPDGIVADLIKEGLNPSKVQYSEDGCFIVGFVNDAGDKMLAYTLQPVVYQLH